MQPLELFKVNIPNYEYYYLFQQYCIQNILIQSTINMRGTQKVEASRLQRVRCPALLVIIHNLYVVLDQTMNIQHY